MGFLKNLFVVDALRNKNFSNYILSKSIHRGIYALTIIGIVEIAMLIISFVIPSSFNDALINFYRLHYVVLASICFIMRTIYKYELSKTVLNYSKLFKLFITAMVLAIAWGGSVTLLDLTSYPQLTVYLTFILLIAAGSLTSPVFLSVIFLGLQILFIYLIHFYQSNPQIIFNSSVNSSMFILFSIFVARQIYYDQYVDFIKDSVIDEKTKSLSETNQRLFELSQRDSLTGLFNRLALDRIMNEVWVKFVQSKTPITILMIDVDKFKNFNDVYGHLNGDRCLTKISRMLLDLSEKYQGYAFRFGGDEFCLVLPNIVQNQLTTIIEELYPHEKAIEVQLLSGETIPFHITVGHASTEIYEVTEPWKLLEYADNELYRIKQSRK